MDLQSLRACNERIDYGFWFSEESSRHQCTYILTWDNQLMILALYVDDVLLVNNCVNGLLKCFKDKLATSGVCHDRFGVTLAFGSIKID